MTRSSIGDGQTGSSAAAEREIIERDQLGRLAASNILGVVRANMDWILDANDEFLRTIGYTRDDLEAGRINWQAMTPAEWLPRDLVAVDELLAAGAARPYEKEYLCKDGSRVPILIGGALLTREPLTWMCFVLDLTEHRRMQEELRYQASLLSRVHDAIIATDDRLRITYWNDMAEATFGWTAAEALGQDADELFQPQLPGSSREETMRELREKGHHEGQVLCRRQDGIYLHMHIRSAMLTGPAGEFKGLVSSGRDISDRSRIEHERLELVRREQLARMDAEDKAERLARLQAVTAALSTAASPQQVAQVILQQALAALNAQAGGVNLLSATGEVELIDYVGYPPSLTDVYRHQPLTTLFPTVETIRTGEPIWLESRKDLVERFPAIASFTDATGYGALAAIPFRSDDLTIGSLGIQFAQDRTFTQEDREFMLTLGQQCAQALERARLYEAEQRTRAQLQLLADASKLLGSSLDYETTLRNISQLMLQTVADHCVIELVEPDGSLRRAVTLAHDAQTQEILDQLRTHYPSNANPDHPIYRVLHSASSLHFARFDETVIRKIARDEQHLFLLRALGLGSLLTVPLIAHGVTLGVISISTYRTRQLAAEDLQFIQELANRAALAIENARLYAEAQAAIRLRDHFFNIAAHELRNPLTTMMGYSDLLAKPGALANTDRAERGLRTIHQQTTRLSKMIGGLLDVSRIVEGKFSLDRAPFNLATLVTRVVEESQVSTHKHTLQVNLPGDPLIVNGDEMRLEQVLRNLVGNAIKYSVNSGLIAITVQRCDNQACVSVADHGIGIPADALPHLFNRFYRAPNAEAQHIPGLGIGLFVIHEIVSQHGGAVDVQSVEGQGTTFTIRLPLA